MNRFYTANVALAISLSALLSGLLSGCGSGTTSAPNLAGWEKLSQNATTRATNSPRNGAQLIVSANYTNADIDVIGDDLISVGGNVEVSTLPFISNPGNPFGQINRLVNKVAPKISGQLTVAVYIGFHQWESIPDYGFNWTLFKRNQGTEASRLAYLQSIGWLTRLTGFDNWVKTTRNSGYGDRLSIVCIPMLEDNCIDSEAYSGLLDVVARYQANEGVSVQYRRSALPEKYFRVGSLPLELHGPDLPAALISGDVWSNDGKTDPTMTANQFLVLQKQARSRGISSNWWRTEWNGIPPYLRTQNPNMRTNLKPVGSDKNSAVNKELVSVIGSR